MFGQLIGAGVTTLFKEGTQILCPNGKVKQLSPGFNDCRLAVVILKIAEMLLHESVDWTK